MVDFATCALGAVARHAHACFYQFVSIHIIPSHVTWLHELWYVSERVSSMLQSIFFCCDLASVARLSQRTEALVGVCTTPTPRCSTCRCSCPQQMPICFFLQDPYATVSMLAVVCYSRIFRTASGSLGAYYHVPYFNVFPQGLLGECLPLSATLLQCLHAGEGIGVIGVTPFSLPFLFYCFFPVGLQLVRRNTVSPGSILSWTRLGVFSVGWTICLIIILLLTSSAFLFFSRSAPCWQNPFQRGVSCPWGASLHLDEWLSSLTLWESRARMPSASQFS